MIKMLVSSNESFYLYYCSHIIANQFTEAPHSEDNQHPVRSSVAGLSQTGHGLDTTASQQDGDSDMETNDAYGDTMIDIGLIMRQDEAYMNEYTTGELLNERQSSNLACNKVTMLMTDNAAYYNMSQVTEV